MTVRTYYKSVGPSPSPRVCNWYGMEPENFFISFSVMQMV